MIVTGESSGELYGGLLARALKALRPSLTIYGVGGERMKEAGVEVFAGITSAFGLFEAVSAIRKVKETFDKTVRMMEKIQPRVVVLIDFPDFNLRVARKARRLGLKVLYYVSPQVWAWRKGRIKTIGELAHKVAVILPFEEALYRERGIPCEFVGHPAMEEIESVMERAETTAVREGGRLALLPGSRPHELKYLLPVLLEVVRGFKREFPDYGFVLPFAPNLEPKGYERELDEFKAEGVEVLKGNAIQALSASDMAVVASGTATLQAGLLERPMVVIYKVSPLSYLIGRLIIRGVKHISLVNLISGRPLVPELIQGKATAGNILTELRRLKNDSGYRQEMLEGLRAVKEAFAGRSPSSRVAGIVCEMAAQ